MSFAARDAVLYAIAAKDADRPVVHVHREVDREFALADAEDAPDAVIEVQTLGGVVELGEGRAQGVVFHRGVLWVLVWCCHAIQSCEYYRPVSKRRQALRSPA